MGVARRHRPRPGQRGLAGRADAPRRPRQRRDRGAELRPSRQFQRRGPRAAGIRRPAHPDRARPQARARRPGTSRRRAHARAAAGQPRAAGGNRRAPARREAAARAVPDHRTVGDHRQPRTLLRRRACRGRRTAVRAQLLHRVADRRTASRSNSRIPSTNATPSRVTRKLRQGPDRIRHHPWRGPAGRPCAHRRTGGRGQRAQPRVARALLARRAA